MEIIISNLSKKYGKKIAIEDINLRIPEGIYGLLGANGAGKTTLIKILSTILQKSSGNITVDGVPIEDVKTIRNFIGYLPQEFSFYPNFTVYETLDYFSALSNIEKNKEENIFELLKTVNLFDQQKVRTKALSGGMKRRLGIAVALINSPKFLLVDEPTVGLDPQERINFRNLLTRYADGRIIILSTHIISDIEDICENIAVLKNGRTLFSGSVKEFCNNTQGEVWEMLISKDQYNLKKSYYEQNTTIVSQISEDDKIRMRILSKEKPCKEAISTKSKLEDSYIKIMNQF